MEIRFELPPLPNYYTAPAHPHATDAAVYMALLNKFVLTNLPTWHEVIRRIITLVSQQVGNRGVSYEEMNFALLIPMPEVNKKHTRMTKHRDLK